MPSKRKSKRKQNTAPIRAKASSFSLSRDAPPALSSASAPEPPRQGNASTASFPIVGIGASAGGLEAFTQLFQHLPTDTGMAFVLIQHLDPRHESMLAELIGRATAMNVKEATEGVAVAPNHVYVIPPNTCLEIRQGLLRLTPRPSGQNRPVDHFFTSLATDQANRAIGVVLSGAATDGVNGLKALRAEGGITFAQEEHSAKYDSMPRAAIAAGVDFVLKPEAIARELARIAKHPAVPHLPAEPEPEQEPETETETETGQKPPGGFPEDLSRILAMLRISHGVDFSQYKPNTIRRRVARRMVLHHMQDLGQYAVYLREHPEAIGELYDDLLINVTGFFRDPSSFDVLRKIVFPHIMRHRSARDSIRIWVPGCSSGEEVYSIAIALFEFLGTAAAETPIQIFGTDVNDKSIEKARSGLYAESALHDVSPDRLRRFFTKDPGHDRYRIARTIRDVCIFAKQNMLKDPPFSRIDLVSCRNVLIYFGATLQRRVIPVFHYALRPEGILILGSAEGLPAFNDLFDVFDRKARIFVRRAGPGGFSTFVAGLPPHRDAEPRIRQQTEASLKREAEQLAAVERNPCGVIVNSDLKILQFRGNVADYLHFPSGAANLHLLKVLRKGLSGPLRDLLNAARTEGRIAQRERILVPEGAQPRYVSVRVFPMQAGPSGEPNYLVLFERADPAPLPAIIKRALARPLPGKKLPAKRQILQLRRELASLQAYLESLVEQHESSEEELKSANEEILSSNEELQSANEELETAKEELQSTNEELTTMNEELQKRNAELGRLNNDVANLLSSIQIPLVTLDSDLRVRSFTPSARKVFNLIAGDVGRPVSDLKVNLDMQDLEALIAESIDSVTVQEREVRDREGRWYSLTIRPYKTADNRIDGAVVVLQDVVAARKAERVAAEASFQNERDTFESSLQTARGERDAARAQHAADTRSHEQLTDDLKGQLKQHQAHIQQMQSDVSVGSWTWELETGRGQWSDEMYLMAGVEPGSLEMTMQKSLEFVHPGDRERVATAIRKACEDQEAFSIQHRWVRADGRVLVVQRSAQVQTDAHGKAVRVVGTLRDVTEQKRLEDSLRELSTRLLRLQDEERRHIARELHDSTSQSLAALSMNLASLVEAAGGLNKSNRTALFEAQALTEQCSREIRTMSYLLHPPLLDEAGLVPALKWYGEGFEKRSGLKFTLTAPDDLPRMHPDVELALFRVVQEALANVHRHSGGSTAEVVLESGNGSLRLEVCDNGRGIDAERLKQARVDLGVGILGMRERVRQLGGSLEIVKENKGTTVRAVLQARPPEPEKAQAEHAS